MKIQKKVNFTTKSPVLNKHRDLKFMDR